MGMKIINELFVRKGAFGWPGGKNKHKFNGIISI